MHARTSDQHNRTLVITDIFDEYMKEMKISINYVDENDGNRIYRAVTLDNVIIPAIIKAINENPMLNWRVDKQTHGCGDGCCTQCDTFEYNWNKFVGETSTESSHEL
jgi:hypothetical protein